MGSQSQARAMLKSLVPISREEMLKAYRGWAPIYDWTFGLLIRAARRQAIARINRRAGLVLDVGVGTGLSLRRYAPGIQVAGVDLSPDMLSFAQAKLRREKPGNVLGLARNDASLLAFADNSFDAVVAMVVLSTTSDPGAVMGELIRVLKPGGELILVNHFSHDSGWRHRIERLLVPFSARLGRRPEFPILPFVEQPELTLTMSRPLAPWGMYTLLSFCKNNRPAQDAALRAPEKDTPQMADDPGTGPMVPARPR